MSSEIVDTGVMQAEMDDGRGNGCRENLSCHPFCQGPSPMAARYIYGTLFLFANISAWVVRENHIGFFEGQRLNGCLGDRDCLAAEVVLIISLASFLFFLVMFFTTMNTRKIHDHRNSWHSQWWIAKGVLFTGSLMISILAPTYLIQLYGKAAHFGAGVFLFIQLLSLIRFITRLNYKWCHTNFKNHYIEVIVVSVIAYSGSMTGIILMSLWYAGCLLNIALIGTTLLLVHLMPLISLKSKAKGFYMEPGLVGAYSVFLCYSAIKSEPETAGCYKKGNAAAGADWKTMIMFFVELISIAAAAFTTGKDYKCIQLRNVAEAEDDVPYGYGFSHFVFATGSMYFGMLFVGWDGHHMMEMWSMDVSWTSVWIHIINEGLAVIAFIAILVARIHGSGGQQQQPAPAPAPAPEREILSSSNGDSSTGAPPLALLQTTNDTADTEPPPSLASHTIELQEISIETATISVDISILSRNGTPPDNQHAAGSSSSPATCASSARRRRRLTAGNWIRLSTRKLMLFFLCVHLVYFIYFTSLYVLTDA